MSYFKHLPTILYAGQQGKNLLARAQLSENTKKNVTLYYPYTINEDTGTRPDLLSHYYYDDPAYDWLIYFANDVVDPYYDLGLAQSDFDKYIVKKYGSIQLAQSKIAFYRTNWDLFGDSEITIEAYEALDASVKKYWVPKYDIFDQTVAYGRKKEDLIINTNKIIQCDIIDTTGQFTVGERVQANSSIYGTCTLANSTVIQMQHIVGANTSNILNVTMTGQESLISCNVQSVTVISENLSSSVESTYWSPVTFYDNESEINQAKKNINFINNSFKSTVEDELKKVMRQ